GDCGAALAHHHLSYSDDWHGSRLGHRGGGRRDPDFQGGLQRTLRAKRTTRGERRGDGVGLSSRPRYPIHRGPTGERDLLRRAQGTRQGPRPIRAAAGRVSTSCRLHLRPPQSFTRWCPVVVGALATLLVVACSTPAAATVAPTGLQTPVPPAALATLPPPKPP